MTKTIITACGPVTVYGGTKLRPEVWDVMQRASGRMVVLAELNRETGKYLAHISGAEAGLVTSGASGALVLQAAAVMTGPDYRKIVRLPDAFGMKDELIIHRAHRNSYDRCYRVAGAKLVDIGDGRRASAQELEDAIQSSRTAGVVYLVASFLSDRVLPLKEVCQIAHASNVPVLVDAAAILPPRENLKRFIAEGADMVAFSGGKGVRGPQGTGILIGKKDLIEAATMNASPNSAIGRPMKVTKEEVVGLTEALLLFLNEDEQEETTRLSQMCQRVVHEVGRYVPLLTIEHDGLDYPTPHAVMRFDTTEKRNLIYGLMLMDDPPVYLHSIGSPYELAVDPFNLTMFELGVVCGRLIRVLEENHDSE